LLSLSCEKEGNILTIQSDLGLLPESPTALDEIKILEKICSYDSVDPVIINGFNIIYTRHTNSSIGSPCNEVDNFISLGTLEPGTYLVTYKLIDHRNSTEEIWIDNEALIFTVSSN
jgi:hypothetical protein